MDNQTEKNDKIKEMGPLFRILLIVTVLSGIVFILYGMIQSNFGYPSLEDTPGQSYRSDSAGTPGSPANTANIGELKSAWGIPQEISKPAAGIAQLERLIWQKTNEERKQRNLAKVDWEEGLAQTARYHSNDMGENDFFDHQNLDNVGPSYRCAKIHRRYIGLVGENIFKMTKSSEDSAQMAEQIMREWMNSTGHRENILNKMYNTLGIGCVEIIKDNRPWIFATQVFGKKTGNLEKEIPQQTQPAQSLSLQVESVSTEFYPPASVFIENVENRGLKIQPAINFNKPVNSLAGAIIKTPLHEGIYQLVFYFPYQKDKNTFGIFPGPMFFVKKEK